jgi:16S rRNA (cytosine967-C5)-methyltransferase
MFGWAHLKTATEILQQYTGDVPFAIWLRNHFRANKKFGSRDRKQITMLCYGYFRLGHATQDLPVEEKMLLGLYLTSSVPSPLLEELKPEWNQQAQKPLDEKLAEFPNIQPTDIFAWNARLSPAIDTYLFNRSLLIQPDLFLRIRPGMKKLVLDKLNKAGAAVEVMEETILRLGNASHADDWVELDKEAVVQDLNSQKVTSLLAGCIDPHEPLDAWDCCAASGGKSIALIDQYPKIFITATDIRESILQNLRIRFRKAGIAHFRSFVRDLSAGALNERTSYDLIVCDAPCSGSGTWGRTPEALIIFRKEKIREYAALQKMIAANAARSLKKGGYFLYITCSVFMAENEEVVSFLEQHTPLQLIRSAYFPGYDKKADTLFGALFQL